jgi:hypothetical protein
MSNLSIVIPIYNDLASLRVLVDRIAQQPTRPGDTTRIIVIDDGSFPPIADQISIPTGTLQLEVVTLKRNVGHQRAIAAGLAHEVAMKRADIIVIMDGDGEDRPEDISRLVAAAYSAGDDAIVVATRSKRSEGALFRFLYHAYRIIFFLLVGEGIRFGNFCATTSASARRLVQMSELWLSLPATIIRLRSPIIKVPTERANRYHGGSHMNLVSLVTHGLSAVAVFMQRVLTRVMLATLGLAIFCIVAACIAIVLKLIGAATPGWMTTVVGIMFVVLILTGAVCLVGLFISMTSVTNPAYSPHDSYQMLIADVTSVTRPVPKTDPPTQAPA